MSVWDVEVEALSVLDEAVFFVEGCHGSGVELDGFAGGGFLNCFFGEAIFNGGCYS